MPELADMSELPRGGELYEPRSLWSVQTALLSEEPQEVRFTREHFYNGTPYPITIKRVAVMGLNYVFQHVEDQPIAWQAADVISRLSLKISAPFRQHYGKFPIVINGLCPAPCYTPAPRDPITSSLWGKTDLRFDHPLYLPRRGSLEWDISTYSPYRRPMEDPPLPAVTVHQLVQEAGGFFAGNARTRRFQAVSLAAGHDTPNLAEGWPYPTDAYRSLVTYQAAPTTFWIPDGNFTARAFKAQETTLDGSTEILELRTTIDQLDIDPNVQQPAPGVGRVSPLSMRVGTRIRTASGGSGQWWWREGAPLALVFDTITPATVYALPYPITLSPKDTLDVTLLIPGKPTVDPQVPSPVNVGISLNGFAAIEG